MATLLAACSSTTFFYNRLDTLINWYVDDYVTLTAEQQADFDSRLNAVLTWHRREELPKYVAFLQNLDELLNNEITPADTDLLFEQFTDLADRLQVEVLNLMLDFGETLSKEQRLEFLTTLEDDQTSDREEFLERDEDEFRKDTRERLTDSLTEYLGRLTPQQRDWVGAAAADFDRLDALWLEDRGRWITQLRGIIETDAPDWSQQVRHVIEQRRNERSPDYDAGFERNTAITKTLLRQVINGRTEKQDRRLRRNLRDYREDFEELIAELAAENSVEQ